MAIKTISALLWPASLCPSRCLSPSHSGNKRSGSWKRRIISGPFCWECCVFALVSRSLRFPRRGRGSSSYINNENARLGLVSATHPKELLHGSSSTPDSRLLDLSVSFSLSRVLGLEILFIGEEKKGGSYCPTPARIRCASACQNK
jgi:hypothetical protein